MLCYVMLGYVMLCFVMLSEYVHRVDVTQFWIFVNCVVKVQNSKNSTFRRVGLPFCL
jgi:hypothetical protein